MTRKFSHALDMVICWTDYLLAFTAINQNLCLSHGFYSSLEHLHHGCNYIRDQFKKVNYFKIGPEIQTVKNACVFKKKGNFFFKICTFFPPLFFEFYGVLLITGLDFIQPKKNGFQSKTTVILEIL